MTPIATAATGLTMLAGILTFTALGDVCWGQNNAISFNPQKSRSFVHDYVKTRNLPQFNYRGGVITFNWGDLRDNVENAIFKKTGRKLSLKTSIFVDGEEQIKNLSHSIENLALKASPYSQHAYFIVFKDHGNIAHQSELILLESENVQLVDALSFKNIIDNQLFEITGQEVLKPFGVNLNLTPLAVKLGYEKVVYILRTHLPKQVKPDEGKEVRKAVRELGYRLAVRPIIETDGSCRKVDLFEKKNNGRLVRLKHAAHVAAENFYFKVDAAFNGNSFFWDDMLVALATAIHHPWLARSTIEFWLQVQQDHGGVIPREIIKSNLKSLWFEELVVNGEAPHPNLQYTNPYLMKWAASFIYRLDPSTENLNLMERVAQSGEQYAQWIENHRRVQDPVTGEFVGLVTNALGSGKDDGRGERGNNHSPSSFQSGWADLLSQQIDLYKSLSATYGVLAESAHIHGDEAKRNTDLQLAQSRQAKAVNYERLLNSKYYDQQRGFYYDLIYEKNNFIRDTQYDSIAGFWPLFSASVPENRVQEIIDRQLTPDRFGGEFPLPANALNQVESNGTGDPLEDGYWGKWSRWPSMAAIISEGFNRSGHPDVAFNLTTKFLRGMAEASEDFKKTEGRDSVFEFYGQTTYRSADGRSHIRARQGRLGEYRAREDFAGWGKVPPVYSLLVDVIGIDPQPEGFINWNLMIPLKKNQQIGVKNLIYNGFNIKSLTLTKIDDRRYEIEIFSPQPVRLKLRWFIDPRKQSEAMIFRVPISESPMITLGGQSEASKHEIIVQ